MIKKVNRLLNELKEKNNEFDWEIVGNSENKTVNISNDLKNSIKVCITNKEKINDKIIKQESTIIDLLVVMDEIELEDMITWLNHRLEQMINEEIKGD